MFGKRIVVISALVLALICTNGTPVAGTGVSPAAGSLSQIGTAFTYQGQLLSNGEPVNDNCDFEFGLWDAAGSGTPPTGGNQVGATQSATNIPVSNGLFAARLDFGSSAFTGEARWLQTAVRCPAGSGEYTTLAPRQALTPVPYALFSQDLSLPFQKGINSSLAVFDVRNDGAGPALYALTNSSGDAGKFRAEGSGAAVWAEAFGSGRALQATSSGTNDVLWLKIDNPDNTGNLINASTDGLGGGAGFRIDNPLNSQPALFASTVGSGIAGKFHADGTGAAVQAWSFGSGRALEANVLGTNDVLWLKINNPDNTGGLVNASTDGLGGGAGFRIDNPLNSAPAIAGSTVGSGNAGWFRTTGSGDAIVVSSSGGGWAANFSNEGSGGGVRISSQGGTVGLSVVGGSKNAVVATSEGAHLLYSEESSAVWFTDYGFGHLSDGSVFIAIDPLFAETVNLEEPYHVFVQAYGDAELYVSQRTPLGFEVRLRAGDPEVEFSYRLVATRRGYEGKRLEPAAWADNDPNLYPVQPDALQEGGER